MYDAILSRLKKIEQKNFINTNEIMIIDDIPGDEPGDLPEVLYIPSGRREVYKEDE